WKREFRKVLKYAAFRSVVLALRYRYIASTTDPGPTTWSNGVISTLRRIQVSNAKIAVPSCPGNTHASTLSTLEPSLDLIAPEDTNAHASRQLRQCPPILPGREKRNLSTLWVERFLQYPRKNLNPSLTKWSLKWFDETVAASENTRTLTGTLLYNPRSEMPFRFGSFRLLSPLEMGETPLTEGSTVHSVCFRHLETRPVVSILRYQNQNAVLEVPLASV
ncbi:hypothetical protein V1478_014749, partial [Vespula squamosa]